MRAAYFTILPMLAAAVLVMVGGERMARRGVEIRTAADKGRLLDLADSFRMELSRLDTLYLQHLENLGMDSVVQKQDEIRSSASEIVGVRLMRIFRKVGKDQIIQPKMGGGRLPEVELADRKRPLDPSTALVLDLALLEKPVPSDGVWLSTADPGVKAYYLQPQSGVLAVFLIDMKQFRETTGGHLAKWLGTPLVPLKEANERVQIDPPAGATIVTLGPARHGPAAAVIPVRSLSGVWQIRSWDGLVVSHSHDIATLAASSLISLVLGVSGLVLHAQQSRALKLAAERVSFVNRVSHELGTPLTNISLNVDLAVDALESGPVQARHRLGIVTEEIERLSRLVANVLTFSKQERDTLVLKPVCCIPGEIVGKTLENFRPALERRGIQINSGIQANEPVVIDPDALVQITGNLLSNVEKYAASGHWLLLTCTVDSDFLELEVHDRGPGIPEKFREQAFKPFERVLDTTREGASGTGLGLSIGRDLAKRMGGSLELLEHPEVTIFRLRIPAPRTLVINSSTTITAA